MHNGLDIAWHTVVKMTNGFFALLPNLCIAFVVFFLFYTAGRYSGRLATTLAGRANMDRTLAHALGKLTMVFTNVLGLLICAVIVVPNFSLDKLIAGLGITSVAIGFAFQNILQNFFAGLLLLWQKPFGIGDEIKARDYEGTVEDITIRTTIIRTHSGQRVYVPNGILFTDPVTVNTAYASRQVRLQIAVDKDLAANKAADIARQALSSVASVAKDPAPRVYVTIAGGAPNLDIYFWAASKNAEILKATDEATFAVQQALTKATQQAKAAKAA